ncbi:DUF190 domain-containing protein [Legionella sp.]|uniref:DUF190 domain-containing protein n=1 Tax=Legionella sp. TaxID=459 RepID=UPI000CAA8ABD|nr:DUF190 domain-containing protein [Legionella sp.]PJE13940.1 MAG: hypothetical protein CK430_05575 [Legionella sp.]
MQKGYQLEFFMEQNERQGRKPLHEWLIEAARERGIAGATAFIGSMGFGEHRKVHSAHFFELLDQPVEVTMIATEEAAKELLNYLIREKVKLFYVKIPVEYGRVGE